MKNTKYIILLVAVLCLFTGIAVYAIKGKKVSTLEDENYVTLPEDYKNMIIENGINYEPTDIAIETYANEQLQMYPEYAKDDTKTAVSDGDMVKVNYTGTADGEVFESYSDYTHEVGSGEFFAEVEEALVGMKAGESKDVEVAIPEGYFGEGEAATTATFHIEVTEIGTARYRTIDTLDEDFCQNRLGYSKEEILERYKQELATTYESQKTEDNKLLILQRLITESKVTIPVERLNARVDENMKYLKDTIKKTGMTEKEFAEKQGYSTFKECKAVMEEQIKEDFKNELILEAVAEDCDIIMNDSTLDDYVSEKISSTEQEDIDNYYASMGTKDAVRYEYYKETITTELLKTVKIKYTYGKTADESESTTEDAEAGLIEEKNTEETTEGAGQENTSKEADIKEEVTETSEENSVEGADNTEEMKTSEQAE